MGLKDTITNLFKSQETKKKEAIAAQEASAEEELQKILSSPVTLKNLCSVLNTKDGLDLFNTCTKVNGKQLPSKNSLPKASEIVGYAKFGSVDHIVQMRTKESEIAKRYHEVQQLEAKAIKGDLYSKMAYPQMRQTAEMEMKAYTRFQNVYSQCALVLLKTAVLSGRIKDINKLQDMVAKTQVENKNRKAKLGLIASTKTKSPQRTGESR